MTTDLVWVVGRGLLGEAVLGEVARRPGWEAVDAAGLPWGGDVADAAAAAAGFLVDQAAATGARWHVVWSAGRAVTSSDDATADAELADFRAAMGAIADAARDTGLPGGVLVASSAGGVYGGSAHPPFDESTPPAPLSAYGRLKLEQERAATEILAGRAHLAVARIANLYGPGQSLEKSQGLVSHLARAQYSNQPLGIYVPLETTRDYLYVDDAAALVVDMLARLADERPAAPVVKILASGRGVTIAALLGQIRLLTRRAPRIVLAASTAAAGQGLDLRFSSRVWPDLDRRETTPLAVGIAATVRAVLAGLAQAPGVRS